MTREEALKIVRENYPHFGTTEPWLDLEKALATLIPELRESEDERIRKAIIKSIEEDSSVYEQEVSKEAMLSWLEKRKEQSIMANDLDEEIHRFFNDYIDVHEAKLYGSISERVIPVDCYELTARHFAKWGKRQKESENVSATTMAPSCWAEEPSLQKEQKPEDRFEEAREKYQVEWSKDDEAAYDAFMCEVVNEKMNPTIEQIKWLRAIRDRLKSLRPQPKQEWSEEDENIRQSLILLVSNDKINGYTEFYKAQEITCDKAIAFLKSLRPSWKPSEHQMNILKAVKEYVGRGSGYWGEGLGSLIEDLEKLM